MKQLCLAILFLSPTYRTFCRLWSAVSLLVKLLYHQCLLVPPQCLCRICIWGFPTEKELPSCYLNCVALSIFWHLPCSHATLIRLHFCLRHFSLLSYNNTPRTMKFRPEIYFKKSLLGCCTFVSSRLILKWLSTIIIFNI